MANISLTATCNRSCSFCFASDAMHAQDAGAKYMPLDRVDAALDFLVRSGIAEARLLGGEPTLHPHFDRIVERVLERGLRLLVFSGGLMPERALRALEDVPPSALSVLLNVIPPSSGAPQEIARQQDVFRRLGARVMLGITIMSPGVDLSFLIELIEHNCLGRTVRLGLAHPTLGGSNGSLHPRHYPEVGRRVTAFGLQARERGIRLEFDCGWVPCMFPEGAMAALGITSADVGLRCSPILDLLPDGRFISCYPLTAHATEALTPDRDATWMRLRFIERQETDRHFMLYRECESCPWRERGECTGGCLSASLGRLRHRDFTVALPESA